MVVVKTTIITTGHKTDIYVNCHVYILELAVMITVIKY